MGSATPPSLSFNVDMLSEACGFEIKTSVRTKATPPRMVEWKNGETEEQNRTWVPLMASSGP